MKQRTNLIATILCLVLTLMTWADNGKFYSSEKLPSSLINCIVQDHYGYVWIGTEYGLAKFDGYHFTNYLHEQDDSTSIIDNVISSFLVDKEGNLWVGSSKGFMRYDYHQHAFIRYQFVDSRKPRPRVYSIIEDHNGNILVGTAGYGLYTVRKGTTQLIHQDDYSRRTDDAYYTTLYEDDHGNLWRSSHENKFTCYNKEGGKLRITDYTSEAGPPMAFLKYRGNALLIVCQNGILSYDYTTRRLADAGFDFGMFAGHFTVNQAIIDHAGNIYIGTTDNGVLMIPQGSKTVSQLPGYESCNVNDIMEDKDGNLWIGCYKKGLYLINQRQAAFSTWSFPAQNYQIGSSISSIACGDEGTTWCTVQNNGIYQLDAEGHIVGHPQSPAGTSIIYRDRQGNYWVGAANTLYSYHPTTGSWQERLRVQGAGIYCMTDDGQGHLFISAYSAGMYIFDTNTQEVKIVNRSMRTPHGYLCNDWIRSMTYDSRGLLWLGTSNGVACYQPKTGAFDTFGWHNLLDDIQSDCLCEGDNGDIIIGTNQGLYLYDRSRNSCEPFPHSELMNSRQICGIVKDLQGNLWVSTTNGIWMYNGQWISHVNGNGLTTREYAQGAVMHTQDDLIGFGNGDGITVFHPATVMKNLGELGCVYLTNFIVDGKPIDCLSDEFSIPYSQNTFALEFSLLNYQNAENITFQYRINGGEWTSTDEGNNTVSFIKLKPGRYKIEMRAMNNGIYSKETKTITVTVKEPWYGSTLAKIAYILLATAIAYVFFRIYERRRKADLEEAKMRFLIDATHDIRSPLTLIMGPLKKLKNLNIEDFKTTDEIHRFNVSILQPYLETIDRNAQRLLLLVNQILDERKIDKNQLQLHCQKTDMANYISGIVSLYQYHAKERGISLLFHHSHERIEAWIDRINFDKVVSNLLSNAMKYTFHEGNIDVYLEQTDKDVVVRVTDTGIGFKDEKTDKLFERFYQGKNTTGFHIEGTGIGLNLSRAITQMHGGQIKAYNRTDGRQGACVEVTIPRGNAHLKPDEIEENRQDTAQSGTTTRHQASKNFHILLVDDDYEIARFIQNELSNWYKFDYAPNGKEAMTLLLKGNYDLVVSDVIMPEMDGITMLKSIKGNPLTTDLPVILLTSKSEVSDRLEGLKRGADAFLAKPFNMEELHILIDNLIDNVRRLRGKYTGAQQQEDKITPVEVKGNNDLLMERIMKSISDHLGDPDFNVERLTMDVGISRAQLHRKMKEMTGISTGDFIRNLRLEQAARLISEGKINVTQVAYSVGFNNQSHFSTVFRKHFGMSPSEYAAQKSTKQPNSQFPK